MKLCKQMPPTFAENPRSTGNRGYGLAGWQLLPACLPHNSQPSTTMLVTITPNHIISAMWHQAQASRVSRAARAARGWAGGRATPTA